MLTSVGEIKEDIKEVKQKLHSIDITMAENTLSLKQHMEQTLLLRSMVLPLHEERLKKIGAEELKKTQSFTTAEKWKIAGTIAAIIGVAITLIKLYKGV